MKLALRGALGAAAALALIASTPAVAFAGERGGNGEATPVNNYVAASLCAFSGLDDMDFEEDVQPGVVQNWGVIPKEVRDEIAQFGFHPGNACNPNGEPLPHEG